MNVELLTDLETKQRALRLAQATLRFEQAQHKKNMSALADDPDYWDLVKTISALESKIEEAQGKLMAVGIRHRPCKICGGDRKPAADEMSGAWWMSESKHWRWRCEKCGFVGDEAAFLLVTNKQLVEQYVCGTCRKPLAEIGGVVTCSTGNPNHSGRVSIASLRREEKWESDTAARSFIGTMLGEKRMSREAASVALYGTDEPL